MIPHVFPTDSDGLMKVYVLPDITGLDAWIDYIPVVVADGLGRPKSSDNNGYYPCNSLDSIVGQDAWIDYVPVYVDETGLPLNGQAGGALAVVAEVGSIGSTFELVSVSVTTVTGSNATDPFTAPFPEAEVGDIVFMISAANGGAATYQLDESVTTDWTPVANLDDFENSTPFMSNAFHYRVVDGTEDATYDWVTGNVNSKEYSMIHIVVRGVDPADIFAVTPTTAHRDAENPDSTPNMPAMTGHAEGDIIITIGIFRNPSGTEITAVGAPSGFTLAASDLGNTPFDDWAVATLIAPDANDLVATPWTNTVASNTGPYYVCTLALNPL